MSTPLLGRFDAFMPNSSDLDAILRQRGIDTLIITGTVTNVCCESTARDANMLGYKVVFVTDATAAFTDEEHNAALLSMAAVFAEVRDTAGVLRLLEASAPGESAEASSPVPLRTAAAGRRFSGTPP